MRNLLFNRLQIDATTTDYELQSEVIEAYGERYPGMTVRDWQHIVQDYTGLVREACQVKNLPNDYPMAAEDSHVRSELSFTEVKSVK